MRDIRTRKAFTMLELIFVIAILGIVASLGAELIAKVYEGYIVQRAEHRATTKTELAATQIANRLTAAIPGTVYRIRTDGTFSEPIDSDFPSGSTGDDYVGIKWVGADMDSFSATATPGWSGFCDLNASTHSATATSLSTPGSALDSTTSIIGNLSTGSPTPYIYFPYDLTPHAASISGTTIALSSTVKHIVEHYKLAWSSYAIVAFKPDGSGLCQPSSDSICDLYLYYDFAATPTSSFTGGSRSLLMKNASTFKFKGAGRTIRFKICKDEKLGDSNVTACKEKAVF